MFLLAAPNQQLVMVFMALLCSTPGKDVYDNIVVVVTVYQLLLLWKLALFS